MNARVGYSKYVKYVGRLMWRIEFQSKGITPDTVSIPVVFTLLYQAPDARVINYTATASGRMSGSKHGKEIPFAQGKLIEVLQLREEIGLAFGAGIEVTVKGHLFGSVVRGGLHLGKGKKLPPIELTCEGTHVLPPRPYRKPPKPSQISNKKKPPKGGGSGGGLEQGETKPLIIPAPGKKGEKPTPGSWSGNITPGGVIELPKVPGDSGSNVVEWKSEGGGDAAPTTRFVIERSEDDGEWQEIAAGTHQAISDPYIQPGHYYQYRVKAQGPGGDSDWSYTGATYTTPKAPTGVSVLRDKEEVTISWVNQGVGDYRTQLIAKIAGTTETEREIDIEKGETRIVLSDLSMYKSWDIFLRHIVSLGEETIIGESSEKITLPRWSVPNAPDMLTPQEIWVAPTTRRVKVSWRHNPTDYSKQSMFQLRIKDPYSGEWQERIESSDVQLQVCSETEITLEDFPFNDPHVSVCEWQVRTAGYIDVFGSWSESAFIRIDPAASSSIIEPKYGGTVTSTTIAVTGESNATLPFTWSIDLVKDGKILATREGRATTDKTFTAEFTGLEDGQHYELRPSAGRVIPTPGITTPFKVQLAAIDAPQVTPAWDSERGSVQVNISNTPDHTENREIARRENDGDWLPIAVNQPVNIAFSDYTPQLAYRIEYRVTTVNQAGNVTYGYGRLEPKIRHVYLTSEDGAVWVKAAWNPTHTRQLGLAHTSRQYFLGRSKPVFLAGKETTRVIQISATILPYEADKELARWDRLATYPKPVLYRDPSGLYAWVAVSDVQLEYLRTQKCWQVSCTCTEVEYRR